MHRNLQSVITFVAVGETGAFVRAAERLGVQPSVISHHIAKLEDELGETLVHRTTRKLTLSDNGRRLFETAQGGLRAIQQAMEDIRSDREDAVGALRVALPAFVPDPVLEARLMTFARRHPHVALTLDYDDQVRDVVEGGYDLSIRLGDLPSSSLMRQKLSEVQHMLVATPEFLLRYGPVRTPEQLADIPHITMSESLDEVYLTRGRDQRHVPLHVSQMKVRNIFGARQATLAGVGFGNLPMALAEPDLATGALVELLPDWRQRALTVQAVWSGTSRRRGLAKRLVDFLMAGA